MMADAQDKPTGRPPRPARDVRPPQRPTAPRPSAPRPVPAADPVQQSLEAIRQVMPRVLLGAGIGAAGVVVLAVMVFVGVKVLSRPAKPAGPLAANKPGVSIRRLAKATPSPVPEPGAEAKPGVSAEPPAKPPFAPVPEPALAPMKAAAGEPKIPESPGAAARPANGGAKEESPPGPASKAEKPSEPAEPEGTTGAEKSEPSSTPARGGVLDDIRARHGLLRLPSLEAIGPKGGNPQEIAKLPLPAGADCQLSLEGDDRVIDFGKGKFLMERKKAEDGTRIWTVMSQQEDAFKRVRRFAVGVFSLRGQSLAFHWDGAVRASQEPDSLLFYVLKIGVGPESESCVLVEPREAAAAVFDWDAERRIELPLKATRLLKAESLRVDLRLDGFPDHEVNMTSGLKPSESAKAEFRRPITDGRAPLADLILKFQCEGAEDRKACALVVSAVAHVPGVSGARTFSRAQLNEIRGGHVGVAQAGPVLQGEPSPAAMPGAVMGMPGALGEGGHLQALIQEARRNEEKARKAGNVKSTLHWRKQRQEYERQLASSAGGAEPGSVAPRSRPGSTPQRPASNLSMAKGQLAARQPAGRQPAGGVKALQDWCDRMAALVAAASKGRIEYRLYTKIGDKEAVLLRTAGFTAAKSPKDSDRR